MRLVELIPIRRIADDRGVLTPVEFLSDLPFTPQRIFYLSFGKGFERGGHAHRICQQVIHLLKGEVKLIVEKEGKTEELVLMENLAAPVISPYTWVELSGVGNENMVAVYASHPYEEDDYIRDYSVFRSAGKNGAVTGDC